MTIRQTLRVHTPRTIVALAAGACVILLASSCANEHPGSDRTLFDQMIVDGTGLADGSTSEISTTTSPTTTLPATTTTVAATTTTQAPATTLAATTTTTAAPTTTTEAPGASLPLRFDGIGAARFGTQPDDVIAYITTVLGRPTADSGWVVAAQIGCDGDDARTVFWDDLKLTFGDESEVSSGRRHFFTYSFGPPAGTAPKPAAMATLLGLSVGTSVAELRDSYPAAELSVGDDDDTPTAELSEGLTAVLTDARPTGAVTAILGGQPCDG